LVLPAEYGVALGVAFRLDDAVGSPATMQSPRFVPTPPVEEAMRKPLRLLRKRLFWFWSKRSRKRWPQFF
jgi:hypothetical protein